MTVTIFSVTLTEEYSVHIINFEGQAWLVSAEISAFFWEKDLLRSQVSHDGLKVQCWTRQSGKFSSTYSMTKYTVKIAINFNKLYVNL